MAERTFDIPGFTFFSEKNNFSGSALKTFNYKIWFGEEFTVKVWYGVNCYSCTAPEDIVAEKKFEFNAESLVDIEKWLEVQLEVFKNKN